MLASCEPDLHEVEPDLHEVKELLQRDLAVDLEAVPQAPLRLVILQHSRNHRSGHEAHTHMGNTLVSETL